MIFPPGRDSDAILKKKPGPASKITGAWCWKRNSFSLPQGPSKSPSPGTKLFPEEMEARALSKDSRPHQAQSRDGPYLPKRVRADPVMPSVHLSLASDEAAHRGEYPNCPKRLPRRSITLGNEHRKSHVVVKHRNLIPRADPGGVTLVSSHLDYRLARTSAAGIGLVPLCEQYNTKRTPPLDRRQRGRGFSRWCCRAECQTINTSCRMGYRLEPRAAVRTTTETGNLR